MKKKKKKNEERDGKLFIRYIWRSSRTKRQNE